MNREAHAAERSRFGFDRDAVNAELNLELSRLVDAEVSTRGLGPYFRIEFEGAGGHR